MIELNGKGLNQGISIGNLCSTDSIQSYKSFIILYANDDISTFFLSKYSSKIIGLCIVSRAETSHVIIMAKSMKIPIIVVPDDMLLTDIDGKEAILDGTDGKLYIEPDSQTFTRLLARHDEELKKQQNLKALIGKENITLDGRNIKILANIGRLGELNDALDNDANGIGLVRSEFLFADDREAPSEELQLGFYRHILEKAGDKPVIIRTFDLRADKKMPFIHENYASTLEGIRFCLNRPDFFKMQLRALHRASVFGRLKILLPMVFSVEEVLQTKSIIAHVKSELSTEGIDFRDNVETGVMIETYSAAKSSDLIASQTDFFSIGTNDLICDFFASDRSYQKYNDYDKQCDSEFLKLIQTVTKNAHDKNIPVGICGNSAEDIYMVREFINLGIDFLSVTPSMILPLRNEIRQMNISDLGG